MNWCIPIIYPGMWCAKGGKLFCFERVYRNDGKPTWIVLMSFRHVGQPPWDESVISCLSKQDMTELRKAVEKHNSVVERT